jgi:hypothetical protein
MIGYKKKQPQEYWNALYLTPFNWNDRSENSRERIFAFYRRNAEIQYLTRLGQFLEENPLADEEYFITLIRKLPEKELQVMDEGVFLLFPNHALTDAEGLEQDEFEQKCERDYFWNMQVFLLYLNDRLHEIKKGRFTTLLPFGNVTDELITESCIDPVCSTSTGIPKFDTIFRKEGAAHVLIETLKVAEVDWVNEEGMWIGRKRTW